VRLEDPSSVFIARRINKLGFSSPEVLQAHFSQYGQVKGVLVSHSRVKSFQASGRKSRGGGEHQRLRAAGLGFVVMESAEDAAKILSEGSEHLVNGVVVQLKPFERYTAAEAKQQKVGNMMMMFNDEDEIERHNVLVGAEYAAFGARERWHSPGSDF